MGSVLYFPVDQVESPTIGSPCFRGRFLVRKWKVKTREQSVSRSAVISTGCCPDAMGMMPGQGMGCADGCARRQRNAKYEVRRAKQSGFAPRGPACGTRRTANAGRPVWESGPRDVPGFGLLAVRQQSAPRTRSRWRRPCPTLRRNPTPPFAWCVGSPARSHPRAGNPTALSGACACSGSPAVSVGSVSRLRPAYGRAAMRQLMEWHRSGAIGLFSMTSPDG
jgi:hypothetical protein